MQRPAACLNEIHDYVYKVLACFSSFCVAYIDIKIVNLCKVQRIAREDLPMYFFLNGVTKVNLSL